MREIKFRAWDKWMNIFHHSWGEGSGLSAALWLKMFPDVSKEEAQKNGFGIPEKQEWHERIIFNQYTGLKDKNGVEIYEGDIDQAENGDKSVIVFLLKAGTYCVMPMDIYLNNDYQNESFFPDFIYGFGYDLFFDNCTPEKYLNIIGNIYENPELLEGNQ